MNASIDAGSISFCYSPKVPQPLRNSTLFTSAPYQDTSSFITMRNLSGFLSIFAFVENVYFISATPTNFTIETPIAVHHCPFQVDASVAANLSSLYVTFSPPQSSESFHI